MKKLQSSNPCVFPDALPDGLIGHQDNLGAPRNPLFFRMLSRELAKHFALLLAQVDTMS
jgi:hypothetical protein